MKVLLTHGYFLNEDPKEQRIMKPYPPLGILYLSAYLKQRGLATAVFDATFSSIQEQQAYILEHRPPYIAIYVNLMTKLNVLKLMQFIRSREELNHCRIILGGPEVRYHADNFLNYGADAIVLGEGEETLYDLISTLDTPMNPFLDLVNGIMFRNARGEIVKTAERAKIKDIDVLPFPDRKAIDLDRYFKAWKGAHGQSAVSISTMRGCPYTCKWCSRAVYGLSYRRRSAAKVVAEIKWILDNYEVDTFWFVDDVFTVSHKWLRTFADELKKQEVTFSYECITRADRMNEEVVDMLVESGCFRVWIGAESGSQKIIDAMDRRVDVQQVRDMIRLAQAKGIQAGTFIMLGYPGETEEDIEETIKHLVESNPYYYTLTLAYPIKGTPLYQEVEPQFIENLPWEDSTDRDIDFHRTYSRKYYDYAIRRVHNEVNYHRHRRGEQRSLVKAMNHKLRSIAAKTAMWYERKRSKVPN